MRHEALRQEYLKKELLVNHDKGLGKVHFKDLSKNLLFLKAKNMFIWHNNIIHDTSPFNEAKLGYANHNIKGII